MANSALNDRQWRRESSEGEYLISTSRALLDRDFINTAFASKDMAWAWPLSAEQMETMLSHTLTFGVYHIVPSASRTKSAASPSSPRTPSPALAENDQGETLEQVALARVITDQVTIAYLTDVYVVPGHRKRGLAQWLMVCCNEVMEEMPAMRRAMLLATSEGGRQFYKRELGFWDVEEKRESLIVMTRNKWQFGRPKGI